MNGIRTKARNFFKSCSRQLLSVAEKSFIQSAKRFDREEKLQYYEQFQKTFGDTKLYRLPLYFTAKSCFSELIFLNNFTLEMFLNFN